MPDDMKSRIANLERELYAKDFEAPKVGEGIRPRGTTEYVPAGWDAARDNAAFEKEKINTEQRHKMMKKIAVGSGIFFVISLLVAGFIWWRGANIISGENIVFEPTAPPGISGGEPFETKILITNNNKVAIEKATLLIEFPNGFYDVNTNSALPRITKEISSLAPGQSIAETVSTVVYGEEQTSKEATASLEYRMAGSNATLRKVAIYAVRITSSPVNMKIEVPKTTSSGQEAEFVINIESNSQNTLGGLLVIAEYPFGFTYKSASPAPLYGSNTWSIDSLEPHAKRTIHIRGVIEGQEGEGKIVRVSVGTPDTKDERFIGTTYNAVTETLGITKPFLGLDIAINDERVAEYAAPLTRDVRVDIAWQSNSPTKVTDAVIEVKLKGDVLNRYSIYASGGGFYRSVDDTIVWQKEGNPSFAVIEPGARGTIGLSFSPTMTTEVAGKTIKNPKIEIEVRARASQSNDIGQGSEITTIASRVVKFNSDLRLLAQGLYYSGPFKNTGALPPKANNPTTYTIKWTAQNLTNSVSDVVVKTKIQSAYVQWLGNVSPSGENITYNENTSEVSWNVGRIPAGGTRTAAFQVSFLPSLSQIGQSPDLVGESTLVAKDDFTRSMLSDRKPSVSTYLTTDTGFGQNQGSVVE